ncbi:MAG: ArsR family transcriptional regulator [Methylococcaceae bacterium]|nr:MAG: ArsR family transcriptional regulator [Methylococcaceae bacterium]
MNAAIRIAQEMRRLAILLTLSLSSQYRQPLAVLHPTLIEMGHSISDARLRGDVSWLVETGLIAFDEASEVATLTMFGRDVALGTASVSGVAKPRPGD